MSSKVQRKKSDPWASWLPSRVPAYVPGRAVDHPTLTRSGVIASQALPRNVQRPLPNRDYLGREYLVPEGSTLLRERWRLRERR